MKLDRNVNGTGLGKYGLINNRRLQTLLADGSSGDLENAIQLLQGSGIIEWGAVGTEDEFFVIKLRDESALPALASYAEHTSDNDFSRDVFELAARSGPNSPFCKKPD